MRKLITLLFLISFTAIFAQNNRQAILMKRQDTDSSRTRDGYWNLVIDTFGTIATVDSNGVVTRYAIEADTTHWTQSSNTLYPKNLSSKVGIGTATPETVLDVDGNMKVVFGSDTFLVDSIFLAGFGKIPAIGFDTELNAKNFGVSYIDASGIGAEKRVYFGQYDANGEGNHIRVEGEDNITTYANNNYIVNVGNNYSLTVDNDMTIATDSTATVSGTKDIYLYTGGSDNWELGYTAFSNLSEVGQFATQYALRKDFQMDVTAYFNDTSRVEIWNSYQVTDSNNYTNTSINIPSTGEILMKYATPTVAGVTGNPVTTLELNSNGLVIPTGSSLPTGEEGALFSLTTDNALYRHNGTYWQELITNSALSAGCGDSTYSLSLTQNVPAPITNPAGDLLSEAVDSTRGYYYSGDTIFASSDHGWVDIYANISVDGQSGSSIKLFVYQNGSSICNCGPEIELSNNRKTQLTFISSTRVSDGDYFQLFIEDRGQNSTTVINNVQFRIH